MMMVMMNKSTYKKRMMQVEELKGMSVPQRDEVHKLYLPQWKISEMGRNK